MFQTGTSIKRKVSPSVFRISFTVAFLLTDILMCFLAVEAAYIIRFDVLGPDLPRPTKENYLAFATVFTLFTVYLFGISGMYRTSVGQSRIDMVFHVLKSIIISLVILLALSFFYRDFSYSRLITIIGIGLAWVLVSGARMALVGVQRNLLRKGYGINRLAIIGTGPGFKTLASRMGNRPEMGYLLVGYIEEKAGQDLREARLLGALNETEKTLVLRSIDVVVITLKEEYHHEIKEIVDLCDKRGIHCYLVPDMVEMFVGPRSYVEINGVPLIYVKGLRIRGFNAALKRAMDIVVTLVLMIPVAPVMAFLATLVRLDSPGPIFYMQKRVGMDGRIFWMYKFRSMRTEAETEEGPAWSQTEDPRVTRLGYLLRKYSLDELPQFINVLRGDMSLVGPRPERPYFVEQFEKGVPRYMERHRVKSGMTGWAQCNGLRGDTSINERVQYDLYYIENWSIWFDFKIILLTMLDIIAEMKRK